MYGTRRSSDTTSEPEMGKLKLREYVVILKNFGTYGLDLRIPRIHSWGVSISIMVVNAYLANAGFFHQVSALVRYTRSPFSLLVALTFVSGLLCALFLNDTIALI